MRNTRIIKVDLRQYNIDYAWSIDEEELQEELIEKLCDCYELRYGSLWMMVDMVKDYIGFEKLEEDFLEDVIKDKLYQIEEEFEEKMAEKIFDMLKEHKTLSNEQVEKELEKKYHTIIMKWDNSIWDLVINKLIEEDIPYWVNDEEEVISI